MPTSACLLVVYAVVPANAERPWIDDVSTMLPDRACFMCGTTARRHSQTPRSFVATTRSNSTTGYSSLGLIAPAIHALWLAASTRPLYGSTTHTTLPLPCS